MTDDRMLTDSAAYGLPVRPVISPAADHPTIVFAAEELARYRTKMDCGSYSPGDADAGLNGKERSLRIGLIADLLPPKSAAIDAERLAGANASTGGSSPVGGNPFDDEIIIDIQDGSGIIAGANPRSCLLAVYRLLREAGCRFLRPGPDGELIPSVDWSRLSVHVSEKPSYRHRGICIEGAVSREVFLGIIDWLPKNGMNGYFIQFREGFTFFDRWYDHKHNPFVPSEAKTIEEIRQIIAEGAAAIRLRGLIYHAVGHGWTCEPLGIAGLSWESVREIPEGASRYFAELNGKRELFGGIPLNTNLCYGNPEVGDLMVNSIVDYASEHPDVDLIHFWLADGTNNHCECPLCRATRPADFYVTMLNDLDARLTARNLTAKIVFLIYVDLLWAPEQERLRHPERFVLMFAPITRTYSQPFAPDARLPKIPPFQRNKLTFPRSASENLAFLKPWQALTEEKDGAAGDSFDFDYHMMWDHYRDPGHEQLAAVLHTDIQNLTAMGLNGLVSCQVQRVFFPSPLLMAVMAGALWNRKVSLDTLATDAYYAAFGPDAMEVRAYLKQISVLFHPAWLRRDADELLVSPAQTERLAQIPGLVTAFSRVIEQHLDEIEPCWLSSWKILALYGDYVLLLADFLRAMSRGEEEPAGHALSSLKNWVFAHEPALLFLFDGEIMVSVFDGFYRLLRREVI